MSAILDALNRAGGIGAQALHAALGFGPREAGPNSHHAPTLPAVRTFSDAAIRTVAANVSSSPVMPFQGNRRASEQYRMLRTHILNSVEQPRVIAVSSACPRDGKTVTAINLTGASSISLRENVATLLIDADLRRPNTARQLGIPDEPGLADVLEGTATLEEAIVRIEQWPSMLVLPAGRPREDALELLDTPGWRNVCGAARQYFRIVIVDAPPIAVAGDYSLIQDAADKVVLVVRPNHTPRTGLDEALGLIARPKLLGVLLNNLEEWPLDQYSNYYYYYQSYYSESRDGKPERPLGRPR